MLLKVEDLCLSYGSQVLVDHANFSVLEGDRLCLVGRNGAGKSTLLKSLAGDIDFDSGDLWLRDGVTVGYLAQDLPDPADCSVFDFIAQGLGQLGADLSRFHELSMSNESSALNNLEKIQQRIEAADGWNFQNKISRVISRLELNDSAILKDMSGGQRRRAALGKALVSEPDVLILDEPTNHLDVASIEWLEQELKAFKGAVLFVTHDRSFLENVATKIGQLDRGYYLEFVGKYSAYLEFREKKLQEEEKQNAEFDKTLAKEEAWIRQGIKARRTRNEGRVRALEKLREQRKARRERQGAVKIKSVETQTSGKLVAELKDVSFFYDENKAIVKNFTGTVMRGDKIGLIGPNGIGKTTFLKLLLGQLQPSSGKVKLGTRLELGFFDQLREQLNLEVSAVDNIAEGREFIEINGASRHALSYLSDFLFSPDRARLPVKALSGGERNRVLLAKLLSHTTNLLVLDEPTNDLDMETLELLEERLIQYDGTVLLVSHDRQFIDNVVTSTLSFEGKGRVREYVGGYQDWVRQGGVWYKPELDSETKENKTKKTEKIKTENETPKTVKLSYKLQRELDELPEQIEKLEYQLDELQAEVNAPEFYQQDNDLVQKGLQELEGLSSNLQSAYERWEELEAMKNGS